MRPPIPFGEARPFDSLLRRISIRSRASDGESKCAVELNAAWAFVHRAQRALAKASAKCDLTDQVFSLIKNTPKVTGFLGADNKPMPISDF